MTKRRLLLQRLALLPLAALLCALLVACGSSEPRDAGLCVADPAKVLPTPPRTAETKTLRDATQAALAIIEKYHVDPAPRLALLSGAWRGASLGARQAGLQVEDVLPDTEKRSTMLLQC